MDVHTQQTYIFLATQSLRNTEVLFFFFLVRSCWKPLQASEHLLLTYIFLIHIQAKQGLLLNTLQETETLDIFWLSWFISCNHWAIFFLSLSFFYVASKIRRKIRNNIYCLPLHPIGKVCRLMMDCWEWYSTNASLIFQIMFLRLINCKIIFPCKLMHERSSLREAQEPVTVVARNLPQHTNTSPYLRFLVQEQMLALPLTPMSNTGS